jgi:hypothetical protein
VSFVNIVEEGGLSTSRGTDNNAESHGEALSLKFCVETNCQNQ